MGKKRSPAEAGLPAPPHGRGFVGRKLVRCEERVERAGAYRAGCLPTTAWNTKGFEEGVEQFRHDLVLGVDALASVRLRLVSLQTVAF